MTYTYDEDNRRDGATLPTLPQVTIEMGYDAAGRQTLVKASRGSTVLTSHSYTYSKSGADTGLRQSVTDLSGTTTYSYAS